MSDDLKEFAEKAGKRLKEASDAPAPLNRTRGKARARDEDDEPEQPTRFKSQWSLVGDNIYVAAGQSSKKLPPGVYSGHYANGRFFLERKDVITDSLARLPDTTSETVLDSIKKFWESGDNFVKYGLVYKRGILLWGPPGSGKTCTIALLVEDLIKRDGLVVFSDDPEIMIACLQEIRELEPTRPIINIIEDIDAVIRENGESELLSMLDGENQVGNIVHLATTNYPEELDPRITNRPSRFDEVIKVGMPSAEARKHYLKVTIKEGDVTDATIDQWVKDTDGLSIAHLRELIVATLCLGRPYEDTLERLLVLGKDANSTDFKRKAGFGG